MIAAQDVTFKTAPVPMENVHTGDKEVTMDIVELKYPDGKVVAFPATDVSTETGQRYCDMYKAKFDAFKNGDPDPDRVEQLEREIEERQAELRTFRGGKAKDDKRVQDNLGYGELKKDPPVIDHNEASRKPPGKKHK